MNKAMLLELAKFDAPWVDFARTMMDLKKAGVTYEQQELTCGEYHGWSLRVLAGTQPKHRSGQILLAMHARYCK